MSAGALRRPSARDRSPGCRYRRSLGIGPEPSIPITRKIPAMLLQRVSPRTSPRALLPSPTTLPSLSSALARRAEIFGPQQLDEDGFLEPAPIPARSTLWRTLGQAARDAVANLAELRASGSGA